MECPAVLLIDADLPDNHPSYFKEMSMEEFKDTFIKPRKTPMYCREDLKRLFITLPLAVPPTGGATGEIKVIPVPFIVDTGAPVMLILGGMAEHLLMGKGLLCTISEGPHADKKLLKGPLFYNGKVIKKPIVHNRTSTMESDPVYGKTSGKVQANLLGLEALFRLGIDICFSEIEKNLKMKSKM